MRKDDKDLIVVNINVFDILRAILFSLMFSNVVDGDIDKSVRIATFFVMFFVCEIVYRNVTSKPQSV